MRMSDCIKKICYEYERVEKMKFFAGYMVGGVLVATSILYFLKKRGVINV